MALHEPKTKLKCDISGKEVEVGPGDEYVTLSITAYKAVIARPGRPERRERLVAKELAILPDQLPKVLKALGMKETDDLGGEAERPKPSQGRKDDPEAGKGTAGAAA